MLVFNTHCDSLDVEDKVRRSSDGANVVHVSYSLLSPIGSGAVTRCRNNEMDAARQRVAGKQERTGEFCFIPTETS